MKIRRATIVLAYALLFGAVCLATSLGLRVAGRFGSTSSTADQQSPVEEQFVHNLAPVIAHNKPSLQVELPFVNRTSRIVRVKEVRHCCGVVSASVAEKELQPGQETKLRLDINVYGRHGKQAFNAWVHSDGGDVWTCRAHTTVYGRFGFDPPVGVRFGSVDPNARSSATAHLLIYARTGETLPDSLQFRPSSEYTTVTAGNPVDSTVEDGIVCRKIPLTVRLSAPAMGGVVNSEIIVSSRTGQGALEEARMGVAWRVKHLYQLTPVRVFFRKAELTANSCEKSVSIRRPEGTPFRILGVKVAHPAIAVSSKEVGLATEHRLLITADPAKISDTVWDEVVVTTDHPIQPTLRIPVAAFAPEK